MGTKFNLQLEHFTRKLLKRPYGDCAARMKHDFMKTLAIAFESNVRRAANVIDGPIMLMRGYGKWAAAIEHAYIKQLELNPTSINFSDLAEAAKTAKTHVYFDSVTLREKAFEHAEYFWESSEAGKNITITMFYSMCVLAWGAFEALAGDLWEESINFYPNKLLSRVGNISISSMDAASNGTFDLSGKMGKVVRGNESFISLEAIRENYRKSFRDNTDRINEIILSDKGLDALAAVRNLIMHKAGIADKVYIKAQMNAPSAPVLKLGEHLNLDTKGLYSLIRTVIIRGVELLEAVDSVLVKYDQKRK